MTQPFDVEWRSFLLGAAVIAIPAFVVFLVNWFGRAQASPFRPQSVVLTTKKTPMQVVMGCAGWTLMLAGLGLAIAVVIIILLFNAEWPEVAWLIAVAVVSFVAGVFARQVMG
jgi:hypothetical protein